MHLWCMAVRRIRYGLLGTSHLLDEVVKPVGEVSGGGRSGKRLQRLVEGGQVLYCLHQRAPLRVPPLSLALQQHAVPPPHLRAHVTHVTRFLFHFQVASVAACMVYTARFPRICGCRQRSFMLCQRLHDRIFKTGGAGLAMMVCPATSLQLRIIEPTDSSDPDMFRQIELTETSAPLKSEKNC